MDIGAYIKAEGLTDAQFALLIGVDRSVVTKIRGGKIAPSLKTAGRIIKATKGAVTLDSLLRASAKADAA
jgi:DNA-binding XRE family transcriptional regulator